MHFLTEASLKRASVTLLIAIALVIGGVYAALRINQELTPDIDFPMVTVITTVPGAGPQDIADSVSGPLEAAIAGTRGLKSLQSVSADSISLVIATFDYGHDMKAAEQEIGRAVSTADLPPEAGTPQVTRININQMVPVVQWSLSGGASTEELQRIAEQELLPRLKAIDGVQAVDIVGGMAYQMSVVADPAKMRDAGISMQQLAGLLQASNVSIPSGSIATSGYALPLRTVSQLSSVTDIENLVVAVRTDGTQAPQPVRLKEVATVSVLPSFTGGISRTNGMPSVGITVTKTQQANTVEVARKAQKIVREVQASLGDRATVTTILDQSTYIKESIAGLTREGLIGAVAAVIAIWLFLMSFRSALVAGISIPLSVVVALLVLFLQGFTLNILTLAGLTIAVGRVVDDSIVVLENIFRHVQEGDDLDSSVKLGAREVSTAIFGSTMTTIAVFLPLGFAGGIVGVFFRPFALTVTFALLASLVVALTVVPVVARFFVGRWNLGRRRAIAHRRTLLQRGYTPVLAWALRHRVWTLGIAAVALLVSFALIPFIPTTFMSHGGEREFRVEVSLPQGAGGADAALAQVAQVEQVIAGLPGVAAYSTSISLGASGGDMASLARAFMGQGTRGATISVRLRDDADLDAVKKMAQERFDALSGVRASISAGFNDMNSQLQISVVGEDPEAVRAAAIQVAEAVRGVDGIRDVTSVSSASQPELAIKVDPQKALAVGLTAAQVAQQVRALTAGQTVTQVHLDSGERVDVVLRADPAYLGGVDALSNLPVGVSRTVPLSTIATIEQALTPALVTRLDQKSSATINGTITAKNTGIVNREVQKRIDALSLPAGVEVQYGGVLQQFMESFNTLYVGIGAAVIIVYVVMVLVMGSLTSPFVIMFSLPLASIGALAALAVTGRALGLPSLLGFLMLVGIVVTNGIVLIDFVNQLRRRGYNVHDALMEGGRLRVRPVLMTAASTILALVPMSLGLTEGAIIAAELATVVMGGLITSTMLTLIVVPVVYSILEGWRKRGQPEAREVVGATPSASSGGSPPPAQETGRGPVR